jgi:hypothetical protein
VLTKSCVAALCLLPALAGCSGASVLSHEELQTEFRASVSLTAETEAFLDHLDGHAYSRNFVDGYLSYLQTQGSDIEKELAGASVPNGDTHSLEELQSETGELMQLLGKLRSEEGTRSPRTIERLHFIHQRLEVEMPR